MMVAESDAPLPEDRRPRPRGTVRAYWKLAGGYWRGPTAAQAWSLTVLSFVLVVGNIAVQYGINRWNRAFFNALQRHEQSFVYQAMLLFVALAFAAALVAVLQLIYRMRLQIRWRQWLVQQIGR